MIGAARLASIRRLLTSSETGRRGMRSVMSLLIRGIGTALTLAYTLLMARVMSPTEIGIILSIWSAVLIAASFTTLNIGAGAVREITAGLAKGMAAEAAGFIAVGRLTLAWMAPPLCLAFVAIGLWRDPGTVDGYPTAILLAVAAIPILGWVQLNGANAAALDRALASQAPRELVRPALFTAAFGLALSLGASPSVTFVLALFLGSISLAALIQHLFLARSLLALQHPEPNMRRWPEWLAGGVSLAPMLLLTEHLKSVILVIFAVTLPPSQVGLAAIALSLVGLLNFTIAAVDMQFNPGISDAVARGDRVRAQHLLTSAGLLKTLPTLTLSLAVALFGRDILALFGEAYEAAFPATLWFLLMPLSQALLGNSTLLLQLHSHRFGLLASTLLGLTIMSASAWLGGYQFGLTGAAAGFSTAYALLIALRALTCRLATGYDTTLFALLKDRSGRPNTQLLDRPIFIVGHPRSGTTLLASMLGRHRDIASLPETHFLNEGRFALEKSLPLGTAVVAAQMQSTRLRHLQMSPETVAAALSQHACLDARTVFSVLLDLFASRQAKPRVLEKTPLHLRHVDTLLTWFPDARIIWIVRDGRACAASLRKLDWASGDPAVLGRAWVRNMAFGLAAERRAGPSMMRVAYEDLVRNPEAEIRRLEAFVGVAHDPAVFDYTLPVETVSGFEIGWKAGVNRPISAAAVDAWRDDLDPAFRLRLATIVNPTLRLFGYHADPLPRSTRFRAGYERLRAGLTGSPFGLAAMMAGYRFVMRRKTRAPVSPVATPLRPASYRTP